MADSVVFMAKLAEQAERYDEMCEYMKQRAETGAPLSIEERNLLSVAYKNAVGSRRASWRIVASVEQKEKSKGSDNEKLASDYRVVVEGELSKICKEIIDLLANILIPKGDGEGKVFFQKMKGDYHRYVAEFVIGQEKKDAGVAAKEAYEEATKTATDLLAVTHPIRLGLALNFSVFYYEVLEEPEEACVMAREAFENAIAELDTVDEDSYKDSTLIMQLLRDNLTLWTSDNPQDDAQ